MTAYSTQTQAGSIENSKAGDGGNELTFVPTVGGQDF